MSKVIWICNLEYLRTLIIRLRDEIYSIDRPVTSLNSIKIDLPSFPVNRIIEKEILHNIDIRLRTGVTPVNGLGFVITNKFLVFFKQLTLEMWYLRSLSYIS